jgi:hypothetical protein
MLVEKVVVVGKRVGKNRNLFISYVFSSLIGI